MNLSEIKPNTEEYIKINDDKLLLWKNKLDGLKKYKVGFVYSGLLSSFIEKHIPLNEFEKLCDLDIELICIQKNEEKERDKDFLSIKQKPNFHLFDIDVEVPFEDTIHMLKNIDLLVAVDTYIVHLAGVLNIETWLLLGYSEWRWSNEKTTYWYDSVKLIRTDNEHKELKDLIYVVKDELQKRLQNS
jgi:ADP-heptose:LPS heptosyltransferase